ncbi:hypothetical protein KSS87_006098 [Heliosperma pusillum]|nr:hypothetical protein KSS87_006098 [Heliosperma pusillum]
MSMMNPRKQGYGSDTASSHLWVGNLPFDISESELMALFEKYGVIDGITCYASRSYAFVYYKRVEDAVVAKESLQGFVLNGNPVRIEFAKPAKPSKHVWVGGFSSAITKEKLEEELSKFGEIEDFKFIRDRNTALVDFVRVEDASAAVKNLNGLQIEGDNIREQTDFIEMGSAQYRGVGGFDSSWINPDIARNYPESRHKRPQPFQSAGGRKGDNPSKVLWVGYPPSVHVDEEMLHNAMILHGEIEKVKCYYGRNYAFVEFRSIEEARRAKEALQGRLFNDPRIAIMFSNSSLAPGKDVDPNFSGFRGHRPDVFGNNAPFRPPLMEMFPPVAPNSFSGPNGRLGRGMMRPFGPRGNLDPLLPTPDFHDPGMHSPVGMSQRKLSPSAAKLLPSPALPARPGHKTTGWDVRDPNLPPRELKRPRTDGPMFHDSEQLDEYVDQSHGSGPPFGSGALARGQPNSEFGFRDTGATKELGHGRGIDDFVWRGVIAKGGTPVCHARCIPMGKELEFDLPVVVNCSARTGLDMLAKHYAGALGFDIVYFLPDSEDDFANYTEFLRYLGSKNRAGVAKLDDGTTLFLVPPSDFLTDVLKVTGRERLYGVVLKLQPTQPAVTPSLQQFHQPLPPMQQIDRPLIPQTHEYAVPKPEFSIQKEYSTSAPQAVIPPKAAYPTPSVPQPQSSENFPSASVPALSLTAELIASLQSIQSAAQSSTPSHSWNHQPQVQEQKGQSSQQFGIQQYPNAPPLINNFPSFATNQNISSHTVPPVPENTAMQNHAYNRQEQGSITSRPTHMQPMSTQGQQYVPLSQATQRYSIEVPHSAQQGYAYSVADSQQPNNPGSYANQLHEGNNSSRPEINLSGLIGNSKLEVPSSVERFQSVPAGVSQGITEIEVDKNQRYQSTLQFAASLLQQIQQKQQQQQQGGSNIGNQQ